MNETEEQQQMKTERRVIGWARLSRAGHGLKLSLHRDALINNCETYTTADGTEYVPLYIDIYPLTKVLCGEQSVTTVEQFEELILNE